MVRRGQGLLGCETTLSRGRADERAERCREQRSPLRAKAGQLTLAVMPGRPDGGAKDRVAMQTVIGAILRYAGRLVCEHLN